LSHYQVSCPTHTSHRGRAVHLNALGPNLHCSLICGVTTPWTGVTTPPDCSISSSVSSRTPPRTRPLTCVRLRGGPEPSIPHQQGSDHNGPIASPDRPPFGRPPARPLSAPSRIELRQTHPTSTGPGSAAIFHAAPAAARAVQAPALRACCRTLPTEATGLGPLRGRDSIVIGREPNPHLWAPSGLTATSQHQSGVAIGSISTGPAAGPALNGLSPGQCSSLNGQFARVSRGISATATSPIASSSAVHQGYAVQFSPRRTAPTTSRTLTSTSAGRTAASCQFSARRSSEFRSSSGGTFLPPNSAGNQWGE
jgi:hypothetical protein